MRKRAKLRRPRVVPLPDSTVSLYHEEEDRHSGAMSRPLSAIQTGAYTPPPLLLDLTQHQLPDRLQLHVRGALVDLADLRVAVKLLHRVILHEPVAAEDLHRLARAALRHLRGEVLGHRRF